MSRTLVLVRHAKAEPYAARDRDRALTERGRADAAAVGRHLAGLGLVPDHALVSAARRTVETWEAVRAVTGPAEVTVEVSEELYAATPASVLESLRLVPEDRRVVVLVGHNPTVAELVHLLDDQEGDPAVLAAVASGVPTAGQAVLAVPGGWGDLDAGGTRLVGFHVGRGAAGR